MLLEIYLQAIQLGIAGSCSLILATGGIEFIAKGEGDVSRASLRHLQKFHLLVVEKVGIYVLIEQVIAFYLQGKRILQERFAKGYIKYVLLLGEIHIHRIALALIAIVHAKHDAAWQGEGVVEIAHEDRTVQAIRRHVGVEGEPWFHHTKIDLWRPNAYLGSGTDVGGHALEALHILMTNQCNRLVLCYLLRPVDNRVTRILVVDHKLDKFPYT